jgi:ParB family transcriptional regulator, chromosome partitioning protein
MAAGKRTSLASLAAKPVEKIPGHTAPTLVRLQPSHIAPTPLNARVDFGSLQDLTELGESMRVRQLQPVVVVGKADYLRLWPEHETLIGEADYVLVNGERRVRAASQVSLPGVDAIVRPHLADSKTAFLDALFTENLDRKNFNAIEEAHAVEAMVAECGTAQAAAQAFRRTEGWISQRRALLRLTPELQDKVGSGELPVRIARSIASLPPANQAEAWRQAREAEQAVRVERRQAREEPPGRQPGKDKPVRGGFTAVKTGDQVPGTDGSGPHGDGTGSGDFTAVKDPAPVPQGGGPGLGKALATPPRPDATMIRWNDLAMVAKAIREALSTEDRHRLATMILDG